MSTPPTVSVSQPRQDRAKRNFAKSAMDFVKSTGRRIAALPGFRFLLLGCAAAAVVMILSGGFRTWTLPLPRRALFWSMLIGWNFVKWQSWFAFTVRRPRDWPRAAAIGSVILILPIPFEVQAAAGLVGGETGPTHWPVLGSAFAIGITIWLVALALVRTMRSAAETAAEPVTPPMVKPTGLLARVRARPHQLAAVLAEDHYCRVRLIDGGESLVHYRFADAVDDLAGIEGARVHRGAWVADAAVRGAERDGRRWMLCLSEGSRVPVSATFRDQARARGWLNPPLAAGSRANPPGRAP